MELTLLQVALVGGAASVLAFIIRFVVAKFSGVVLSRGWITVVAYVVSVLLAFGFSYQYLPILGGDPAEIVNAIVTFASALFGLATLIYNLLLGQLLGKLGMASEALKRKFGR